MIDIYEEFKYDLGIQADLTRYQCEELIKFLESKGIKVYEMLQEIYGEDAN